MGASVGAHLVVFQRNEVRDGDGVQAELELFWQAIDLMMSLAVNRGLCVFMISS